MNLYRIKADEIKWNIRWQWCLKVMAGTKEFGSIVCIGNVQRQCCCPARLADDQSDAHLYTNLYVAHIWIKQEKQILQRSVFAISTRLHCSHLPFILDYYNRSATSGHCDLKLKVKDIGTGTNLARNGCRSFKFLIWLWPSIKIKVIYTVFKLQSSAVLVIGASLTEISWYMSEQH